MRRLSLLQTPRPSQREDLCAEKCCEVALCHFSLFPVTTAAPARGLQRVTRRRTCVAQAALAQNRAREAEFGTISLPALRVSSSTPSLVNERHTGTTEGLPLPRCRQTEHSVAQFGGPCPSRDLSFRISQSLSLYPVAPLYIGINHHVPRGNSPPFPVICAARLSLLCSLSSLQRVITAFSAHFHVIFLAYSHCCPLISHLFVSLYSKCSGQHSVNDAREIPVSLLQLGGKSDFATLFRAQGAT